MSTRTLVPGLAGARLERLGDRAVLGDLYDDRGAPVYDDVAGRGTHEVRELVAMVRRAPGPILELAAGSGRLTLPLLTLGRQLTALELSASMLRRLDDRLATVPARLRDLCIPVRADMSDFALDRRFGVIVLGTTSISLLDRAGRTGLYRAVRRHLAPGGRFVLSTVDLDGTGPDPIESRIEVVAAPDRVYDLYEHWVPVSGLRTVTVFPAESVQPATGPVTVCTTSIGVLSADRITAELAEEGIGVITRQVLPAPGERHSDVLLETAVRS
ncbi:daptide-type RiPP biosynthesis methyltransferase [Actinoplanes subglobosus]|uniref:Daptide-type RiPP biosynthesis methyltransferase n=1 Tax=Actinoplanes subglobosus TaxID=1547892 RepID=A0ABV8IX74_9ACTN